MGKGDLQQRGPRRGRPNQPAPPLSLSRVLGEGEDPLTWSATIFANASLRIRLHALFILVAVGEVILSAPKSRIGTTHVLIGIAALFMLVLIRELGRWFVTSRTGDAPGQIVLWPLGLLSTSDHPRAGRPGVLSAASAMGVNLLLVPALGAALWATGQGWDALIFDPRDPSRVLTGLGGLGVVALWWLYYLNLVLLATNLLLPMLPLDAGRIVELLLARRLGLHRAAVAASRVGLLTAMVLFVAAMSADMTRVMGLAAFGTVVCWIHFRRAEFIGRPAPAAPSAPPKPKPIPVVDSLPLEPAVLVETAVPDDSELDRLLAKISASGLASLTPDEHKALARATERRRNARTDTTNNR